MSSSQEYNPEAFWGKYEQLIRDVIGSELDNLKKLLRRINMDCLTKLSNIESGPGGLTVQDLLDCSSEERCQILSAILYDEALWRLEAAYLMISAGLLNIAYANIRESREALVKAFITHRIDSEAKKFLEGKEVDPTKIEAFLPPNINQQLMGVQKICSIWGTHTYLQSVQLTTIFGPGRFQRVVAEVPKVNRKIELRDGFADTACRCIKLAKDLGILFIFLLKKSLPPKSSD